MHGAFEQSLPDGRRRAMALPTPCDFYNVFYQLLFPARDRVQINGKEMIMMKKKEYIDGKLILLMHLMLILNYLFKKTNTQKKLKNNQTIYLLIYS